MPPVTTEQVEQLTSDIAELTNQVKESGLNDATIDYEKLGAQLEVFLTEQRGLILDNTPARPGVGPYGSSQVQAAVSAYDGKYAHDLRQIAADGSSKFGNWELKGIDLVLADKFLQNAFDLKDQPGNNFLKGLDIQEPSKDLKDAVKALTSTGSGTGLELLATETAGELWQDFFSASIIANDIPNQPMPSDPFNLPIEFGDLTWRKGTQVTAPTATDLATAEAELKTTEQVGEVDWSYDIEEDAVIAMMPNIRRRISISGGEQMDDFLLNADKTATATGNINLDDDTPAASAYYLARGDDGIRHLPIVDNTGQLRDAGGDALVTADMDVMLQNLGKYALDIQNVRIVPGIAAYFAMVGLSEVKTVDQYGMAATILSGELGRYRGYRVMPSASMKLTEADGKLSTTAGNNTLGAIAAYHREMWRTGFRRNLLFEVDRDIQKRMLIMVVSYRMAMSAHGTRSAAIHTAGIRNILV